MARRVLVNPCTRAVDPSFRGCLSKGRPCFASLVASLCESPCPLTLVCGPNGTGKSALLQQLRQLLLLPHDEVFEHPSDHAVVAHPRAFCRHLPGVVCLHLPLTLVPAGY